ncbi:MAG: nucleotidyltransferase domain-containing protein [Methanomassiliicoccaceae archaeon]|nr:nucleotidyltransferase domain-containing protein [Methanomassiliicoccaceae archaeon]
MSAETHEIYSIEELKAIIAPVAERYGVEKIYLFGSVARGDYNGDSDYDFCIEKGKIRSIFTFSGFFKQMQDAVGNEIDIVTTKGVPPEILDEILKESVVVYG